MKGLQFLELIGNIQISKLSIEVYVKRDVILAVKIK